MRIVKNPEEFRKKIQMTLNNKLKREKYSVNLEKGIYNWSLQDASNKKIIKRWDNEIFVAIYLDRFKTIMINLENSSLIEKIVSKEIKPHQIAFLTHQEMSPEKWTLLIEKKKQRDQNMYEPKIDANTDNFTCRKCKSTRCSYYQLQTRSADEPMTTFVTCIDCGNRWKC